MTTTKRFGEEYRKGKLFVSPGDVCEICGGELEFDPESGEAHCTVCEEEAE